MTARDKYIKIFGKIDSLEHEVSWSTGVSNMLEWLTWSTNDVLGVTKTKYREEIVKWSHDAAVRDSSLEAKQDFVKQQIDIELRESERHETYDPISHRIASPREALRRAKFFSEDYLNKEFDIFWTLASDTYLDKFYRQFTKIEGGGRWFTHGNSGLFAKSTEISDMQMDNLSYNPSEGLLVANELKLGGKKNPDQILKYALMYRLLRDGNFIKPETRFFLLFIGDIKEMRLWEGLIAEEEAYCRGSSKSTAERALHPEGIKLANTAEKDSTTWRDLVEFNKEYLTILDLPKQQVEQKLIWGFNETLLSKKFMQLTLFRGE